jgi:hypothetical protein
LNLDNKPQETVIHEKDFSFHKSKIDDLGYRTPSLTAIFVARKPVTMEYIPLQGAQPTFVDSSFSRSVDHQVIKIEGGAVLTDITFSTQTNLGPLFSGDRYCQMFVARNNNLMAISVNVATYCKQIDSVAKLFILDAEDLEVIRVTEMNTREFIDNTWQTFYFHPISESMGKKYLFCIESSGTREAITLWTNSSINGICKKDGLPVHAICFRSYYQELPANSIAPI